MKSAPINGDEYRDLARRLRELARLTRISSARMELARLAARYDQRAECPDELNANQ
jgi:hypothetical protein